MTPGHLWHLLFAPGFFQSSPVGVAVVCGGMAALVSGMVGLFTVVRGQSFAGHALADVGATGGSGAILLGLNPLWGFVVVAMAGAGLLDLFGVRRPRGRDVATGVMLGAALGFAALFLYWDSTLANTSGATATVLFGSMFIIPASTIPVVLLLGAATIAVVAVCYRPLLLSSVSTEMATARGVSVRLVGALYLAAMAVAVSLSCLTIGAILSTALLIGPPATALRLTRRPGWAVVSAGLIGVTATWLGIVLSYDSFTWPPAGHGWPVSFFVVTLVFAFYLLADVPVRLRARRQVPRGGAGPEAGDGG